MLNYNGKLVKKINLNQKNRAFKFGDGVFETIKIENGYAFFLEDHYSRIIQAMKCLHFTIPRKFTFVFFKNQIFNCLISKKGSFRCRFTAFRKEGGYYCPSKKGFDFIIEHAKTKLIRRSLSLGLYTSNYKTKTELSNYKTINSLISVLSSIYAAENLYDDSLILNQNFNVIESSKSNLFIIKDNKIFTPPKSDGCVDGVVRKKLIKLLENNCFFLKEKSLKKDDILLADEVFLTNSITPIQRVKSFQNKKYEFLKTKEIIGIFKNEEFRLQKGKN